MQRYPKSQPQPGTGGDNVHSLSVSVCSGSFLLHVYNNHHQPPKNNTTSIPQKKARQSEGKNNLPPPPPRKESKSSSPARDTCTASAS